MPIYLDTPKVGVDINQVPWNDTDELDKRRAIKEMLRKIKELEERIEFLEMRLNYSDRR